MASWVITAIHTKMLKSMERSPQYTSWRILHCLNGKFSSLEVMETIHHGMLLIWDGKALGALNSKRSFANVPIICCNTFKSRKKQSYAQMMIMKMKSNLVGWQPPTLPQYQLSPGHQHFDTIKLVLIVPMGVFRMLLVFFLAPGSE